MNKESKTELAQMLSLMERMDCHLTKEEADAAITRKLINENVIPEEDRYNEITMDGNTYKLDSPEHLIQALTKKGISPKKSWYVTIGYVKSFDKLGNSTKNIKSAVDSFNDDDVNAARGLNSPWLNNMLDNQITNKKGQITNPYMTDSYTNYIAEVSLIRLMYGRNEEYAKQKSNVQAALAQYEKDNPDDVAHYKEANNIVDFARQGYDDARQTSWTKIPDVNGNEFDDGSYELQFNTPKSVFKKIETKYFLITDEDNISEISAAEAEAYAKLYGVEPTHRAPNSDTVIAKIDADIKKIKAQHHGGDVWTRYPLDGVFLMNFSEGEDSSIKLQYYNPNAIVRFVKGRQLKSGTIPSRYTSKGAFASHFDKLKEF